MTALLVEKRTIKMDKVTAVILQNEILRRENSALSLDGSSALVVSGRVGGGRRSDRSSRRGQSMFRMKDLSKTRYYQCDELGYLARVCSQHRDR